MQVLRLASILFGLLLLAMCFSQPVLANDLVFIVHSYEEDHVCGQPQANGVVATLREVGLYPGKVTIRSFYMDTKMTYTSPEQIEQRGRLALEEIERLRPTVVVTLDDNAFRHVGLALAGRDDMSVVFCGMNAQPEDYNQIAPFFITRDHPGYNITGIYEKLHLRRALNVLAAALPGLTRVVGITDVSPTGNAVTKQFEIESSGELPVEWEVRRVSTFEEYQELIMALNATEDVQAIYPVALTLATADGGRVTAPDIFRWTIEHSQLPEIPLNYYFCRLGLFGGASVDFEYMGRMAGTLVASILEGQPAGELPIAEATNYAIVFNTSRADMLGIQIPDDVLLASDAVFTEIELFR